MGGAHEGSGVDRVEHAVHQRGHDRVAPLVDDAARSPQLLGGAARLQLGHYAVVGLQHHLQQIGVVGRRLREHHRLARLGLVPVAVAGPDLHQQHVVGGDGAPDGPGPLEAAGGVAHRLAAGQHHARDLAPLLGDGGVDDPEQVVLGHAGTQLLHHRYLGGVADAGRLLQTGDLLIGEHQPHLPELVGVLLEHHVGEGLGEGGPVVARHRQVRRRVDDADPAPAQAQFLEPVHQDGAGVEGAPHVGEYRTGDPVGQAGVEAEDGQRRFALGGEDHEAVELHGAHVVADPAHVGPAAVPKVGGAGHQQAVEVVLGHEAPHQRVAPLELGVGEGRPVVPVVVDRVGVGDGPGAEFRGRHDVGHGVSSPRGPREPGASLSLA